MFIVIEGGEGSGKSTQAKALKKRLSTLGFDVVLTHEPGGTLMGRRLRRWIKWGKGVTVGTELLLFLASRSQLVSSVIRPALEKGRIVICDRFDASTIAYQGFGRGIDLFFLKELNDFVVDGLQPDLVILLDVDVEQGLSRKRLRSDAFEREEFTFHMKVREGYLALARANPERWLVVDASLCEESVRAIVWNRVMQLINSQLWPCTSTVLSTAIDSA
jgi:dTMP kinase